MPPQSSPSPQPNYDFFLSPQPKPKRNLLGDTSSMKKRIAVVLGGGALLIIIVIIFSSLLGGKTSTTGLLSITQQQNELIRVSGEASTQAAQQTTQNVTVNIELSLTTGQQQLLAYLKTHGQKVSVKQLALTQSAATDQQLAAAEAASNYDAVYLQIMQSGLTKYMQILKQTFSATFSATQRQLLNTDYQDAGLLLSQTNSAIQALQSS